VRELENVIERELILQPEGPLTFHWLETPTSQTPQDETATRPAELETVVTEHIQHALRYADGKVGGPGGAAEILGVNPSTLRHRMKKLGIPYGRN